VNVSVSLDVPPAVFLFYFFFIKVLFSEIELDVPPASPAVLFFSIFFQ
jgi:hypothetical protein